MAKIEPIQSLNQKRKETLVEYALLALLLDNNPCLCLHFLCPTLLEFTQNHLRGVTNTLQAFSMLLQENILDAEEQFLLGSRLNVL